MFDFSEKTNKYPPFSEVDVFEMAERREKRAAEQAELFQRNAGCFVVSLTLNIAGPVKRGALSDRVFVIALNAINSRLIGLGYPVEELRFVNEKTGIEALMAVRGDAETAKERFLTLEETLPGGRLLDIDVLVSPMKKLGRSVPRRCLICGETAADCARSRAHSVEELQKRTGELLADAAAKHTAELAKRALIDEVHLTPKPGLVDENNCGANPDMSTALFEKSAETLRPYFEKIARLAIEYGVSRCGECDPDVFAAVRRVGIEAEKAMLEATGGVNTHRGAIYALGLGAFAHAYTASRGAFFADGNGKGRFEEKNISAETLLSVAGAAARELGDGTSGTSNGALVRKRYGIGGAVEQAFSCFPLALLAKNKKTEYYKVGTGDTQLAWAYALAAVMSRLDDNNAYKRGGSEGAAFVKARASELLPIILYSDAEKARGALMAFDTELIEKNINCGGAADLLALAIFVDRAEAEYAFVPAQENREVKNG